MSLARKTLLIVAVPILFQIVFLGMSIEGERLDAQYRAWQARSTESALSASRLLGLVNDAQAALSRYAMTGDDAALPVYYRSVEHLPAELEHLERLSAINVTERAQGGSIEHTLDDVKAATAAVVAHLQSESALVRLGRRSEAIAQIRADEEGSTALSDFRRRARGYQSKELDRQRAEYAALEEIARERHLGSIGFVLANAILALVLLWLFQRRVRSRIRLIVRNMRRFAAGEPLHAAGGGTDEISYLDEGFHAMALQIDAARRDLEEKNAELAAMNREKNKFIGMAAHDLRSPLSGVLFCAEALLRQKSVSGTNELLLRRIQTSVRGMTSLVNDFLDVSLIEAGELRLRLARTDLVAVARDCIEMQQVLAKEKEIELAVTAAGTAEALVDRDKIAQVVTNLITNALKFSPPGTRVEVRIEPLAAGARVSVVDQGQGIAAEEMTHLFQPFSRTSTRATAGEGSTGLGLAICRRIVEGHGGRIGAESELGKGSTFWFEITAVDAAAGSVGS
ncbi:MAG: histidine kinase [Acidobacteria bacterium]|nr:histidine kinase [Acidobacteriota bacterium]